MAAPFFYGSQASIAFGAPVTLLSTDELNNLFTGTDFSSIVKEASLTIDGSPVEITNVFGDQLKEESRPELVELEVTAVFRDVDLLAEYGLSQTTLTSGGASFTPRYSGVDAGDVNRQINRAVLFRLTDGTRTIQILMNNANLQGPGEISLAADGSAEWSGTWACKFTDLHIEDNI